MLNRVTFLCPSLSATGQELGALGIVLCRAEEAIVYRYDRGILMAEVGALVVTGAEIRAIPRVECTGRQMCLLLGAAELAFHVRPTKASGWRFSRAAKRWESFVWTPVPSTHPVAQAVRSERRVDEQGELAA